MPSDNSPNPGQDSSKNQPELFTITIKNQQVLLKVLPPLGQGFRVLYQTVVDELRQRDITGYDHELVKKTVNDQAAHEVVIGQYISRDAEVEVQVAKDAMSAALKISPPGHGGAPVDKSMLKKALTDKHVIFGIKERVLDEIVEQQKYDHLIVVAVGIPAKNGEDAQIEYKIDIEHEKPDIKVKDDGSVDLKEMNLIENVVEGQLLAVKIPARKGEPGVTVYNKHIVPKPSKDIPIPAGKNTRISDDGMELYAAINGMAVILAGKINIDPIYQVKGDVGPETGNINFIGSVVVHGSVIDGFSIKAEGNIEVRQSVSRAKLEADGDITVQLGIVGHNETEIKAGGNVKAKYVQDAVIMAAGDVLVQETIMHAQVEAGDRVILYGKKGMIVGGTIIAYREVNAKNIGTEKAANVVIEVGVRPALREELKRIDTDLLKDNKNLEQIDQGVKSLLTLKKVRKGLPNDKENLLISLTVARKALSQKIFDVTVRRNELEEQIREKISAKVCVAGDIYPGVKIGIRHLTRIIDKKSSFCTFFEENGEIQTRTYDEPRKEK